MKNNFQNKIVTKNFFDKIPRNVLDVCEALQKNSFESYLVGGCVRDLLMERKPNDFDIATNAKPEDMIKIFGEDETVDENKFGTVGVKIKSNKDKKENGEYKTEDVIEVTTFRKEGEYEDFRRPSKLE